MYKFSLISCADCYVLVRLFLILAILALSPIGFAAKPSFALKDLDGSERQLADFRGRWVVVNYWATWCPPCIDEMPDLMDFHETHRSEGVTVVGINVEEIGVDELRRFVESLLVDYPILLSGAYPPDTMPPVIGLPTTFVVSPKGDIVATELGQVTQDFLHQTIQENGGELVVAH